MLRHCLLPLVVLWLVGCAELTTPALTPVLTPTRSTYPQETTNSLEKMLRCFEQAVAMQPETVSQEIARLEAAMNKVKQNKVEQSEDDFYESFRLACILVRADASDAELTRAHTLLEGLAHNLNNTKKRLVVHLLERTLILQQQLRHQQGQTLKLKEKIEQLKGLERDLERSHSSVGQIP